MDFALSDRSQGHLRALQHFMVNDVYPAERVFRDEVAQSAELHMQPPIMEQLKKRAQAAGLWNLFLPHRLPGTEPLSNLDYAPLAELSGRSPIAPEALNSSAPDTGNMELLTLYGTDRQKDRWLYPLLNGEMRSSFIMTEPDVASSDARNISTRIERRGGDYVINGRKWWITGAGRRDRCKLGILLGLTDPDSHDHHRRHSMILVPLDAPGLTILRDLPVFGYNQFESHVELTLNDVHIPVENLLGEEGSGFAMAQARLGPGRIHHCMRLIGAAERALDLMIDRAKTRIAFGQPLVEQGTVGEMIATSRMEIDQARMYVFHAAWLMDTVGNRSAASQISGIKATVPRMAGRVIDRAIQVHGAGGLSDDFPLARMYADSRILRFADGPDEVHMRAVLRAEIRRHAQNPPVDKSFRPAHQ
jgi:acyl-CoA dehydrogenase